MTAPIAEIARASSEELSRTMGPSLVDDVEDILWAQRTNDHPQQYVDGVAVASLVVSAAALAWTICIDMIKQRRPSAKEIAAKVENELQPTEDLDDATRRTVIIVVVANAISAAEPSSGDNHRTT